MRRSFPILLVVLGRPLRHGCWTTEPKWTRGKP